jgi:hypothetical protein
MLWGIITVNGGVRGSLAGLTFPIGQDEAAHSLRLDMPDAADVRWPAVARGQTSADGLAVSLTANGSEPQVMILSPNGMTSLESVTVDKNNLVGKTALCLDAQDRLHLIWSALRPDGEAVINYAVREKPAK